MSYYRINTRSELIQNKTTLYIAMSLDGFISGENDNLDFLNPYHVEGED